MSNKSNVGPQPLDHAADRLEVVGIVDSEPQVREVRDRPDIATALQATSADAHPQRDMLALRGACRLARCRDPARPAEALDVEPVRERRRIDIARIVGPRCQGRCHDSVDCARVDQRTVAGRSSRRVLRHSARLRARSASARRRGRLDTIRCRGAASAATNTSSDVAVLVTTTTRSSRFAARTRSTMKTMRREPLELLEHLARETAARHARLDDATVQLMRPCQRRGSSDLFRVVAGQRRQPQRRRRTPGCENLLAAARTVDSHQAAAHARHGRAPLPSKPATATTLSRAPGPPGRSGAAARDRLATSPPADPAAGPAERPSASEFPRPRAGRAYAVPQPLVENVAGQAVRPRSGTCRRRGRHCRRSLERYAKLHAAVCERRRRRSPDGVRRGATLKVGAAMEQDRGEAIAEAAARALDRLSHESSRGADVEAGRKCRNLRDDSKAQVGREPPQPLLDVPVSGAVSNMLMPAASAAASTARASDSLTGSLRPAMPYARPNCAVPSAICHRAVASGLERCRECCRHLILLGVRHRCGNSGSVSARA